MSKLWEDEAAFKPFLSQAGCRTPVPGPGFNLKYQKEKKKGIKKNFPFSNFHLFHLPSVSYISNSSLALVEC
jgi:hypothetical protein